MEHCRSPDGVTSVSVRPYYTMLSSVYLALAMGFLVLILGRCVQWNSILCLHLPSNLNSQLHRPNWNL